MSESDKSSLEPRAALDFTIYCSARQSYVAFRLEQYLHKPIPCVSCAVDIVDNKFRGLKNNVWFEIEDITHFIRELECLNMSDHASLHAMSPNDFKLTFERTNRKGDFILTYHISERKYNTTPPLETTLSGAFEFDQEYMSQLTRDLKRFLMFTEQGVDG